MLHLNHPWHLADLYLLNITLALAEDPLVMWLGPGQSVTTPSHLSRPKNPKKDHRNRRNSPKELQQNLPTKWPQKTTVGLGIWCIFYMIYEFPPFFPLQDIHVFFSSQQNQVTHVFCLWSRFLRPSLPSSQLRDQRISIQSGGSVSGPVPVMTHNNCPEPANLGRSKKRNCSFFVCFPRFWVCLFIFLVGYKIVAVFVSLFLERWPDFFGGFRSFLRWDWGREYSKAFNKHPFEGRMRILKELIIWIFINPENSWIHWDSHNRTGSCSTKNTVTRKESGLQMGLYRSSTKTTKNIADI